MNTKHKLNRMFVNILSILAILAITLTNAGSLAQAAQQTLVGDWDENFVRKASVLHDESGYKMWYDGENYLGQTQVGLATSTDGASWTKYFDNPVLSGDPEAWDSSGEHAPFIIKDGGLYKMWYEGSDGNVRQLGYATSPDGITWTKYGANPVLLVGPDRYDDQVAGHGSVLYDDGMYKLWYHAVGDQGAIIAYAISFDGVTWGKVGPVLWGEEGLWDEYGMWGPSVLKMGDIYWMWYSASGPSYIPSIGAATSPDGEVWTRVGNAPVITIDDNYIGDPHVIFDEGIFKMWFNNFSDGNIYYADSNDGINWDNFSIALTPPPPPLNPHFTVYPVWEAIEAWDWPEGVLVTATVSGKSEDCNAEGTAEYPDWDLSTTNVWMNFPDGCDVVTGDEVILSAEGVPDVSHTVQNLSVTNVNADADNVVGTADSGVTVYVWPHGFGEYEVQPTAGGDNVWVADFFSEFGDILQLGMDGRAEVRDDYGNSTAVDWHVPKPRFTVYPEWEAVEAWDWPADVLVTATVVGNEDTCTTDGYPIVDPWGTNVWMNFPDGCDVVVGNEVTLSAEGVPDVSHTVQNLSVTEVNADADTVAGTADSGVTVYVWPHGFGEYEMQPTAGGDNVWVADFSGFGDVLQPGMDGRSEVRDDYGNSTAVDWHAPNPLFTVFPEQSAVEGWDWPLDSIIHLTIEDLNTDDSPDYQQYEAVTLAPWGSRQLWVWFEFPDEYDIKPGDVVTLTDGITERTHVVQNLDITGINLDDNQVYGTTDGEKNVTLWSWEDPDGRRIETTSDGNWSVDFDDIGFTLEPGYHVRAEIWVDGNDTAVDRYIPNPRFTVFPEWEWFDGIDWPDGSTVSINVEGKDVCTTDGTSWDYFFNGGFPEGCDVVIGDTVTFTDGTTVRTHTVRNLSVTKVEPGNDIVKGTADASSEIHVWPHATGQEQIVTTNPKGKWNVSFLGIYDLMPGDGGRAEIRDKMGNATAVDWYIPKPRIVASITEDWFFLQEFSPNKTLSFTVYQGQGEKPIWKGTATTDDSGFAWIDAEGRWDLEPGVYLVVKDGSNSKDLVIEGFTFDIFDAANGQLSGTAPEPYGRNVWVGVGWEGDGWSMDITTDENGAWFADFGSPVPTDYQWVAAQIFDNDGDASELRPASQIIYLRASCGTTYTVQTNALLEIGYGGWLAIGEDLAIDNAQHLTVDLVIDGELVTGVQQPVVPGSEIPCFTPPEDAYGVFYVTQLGPLDTGAHVVSVTWSFDAQVTDGYDSDGDGQLDLYGPGEVATQEFTIIVQ